MALSRRKKPAVLAGSRGISSGGGTGTSQRTSRQLAGKRKTNELARLGESFEPANRRPPPDDGTAPLPASASDVTGEKAATCSRQLEPPEGGATYAAVLAGAVVPSQPCGPLKPTAMGLDLS
jgi:hypothetical protein